MLARARRLDEDAAAAAVAAADGYVRGWEGIDFSSAMSNRPCNQDEGSQGEDSDMPGPASVAITVGSNSVQNEHIENDEV